MYCKLQSILEFYYWYVFIFDDVKRKVIRPLKINVLFLVQNFSKSDARARKNDKMAWKNKGLIFFTLVFPGICAKRTHARTKYRTFILGDLNRFMEIVNCPFNSWTVHVEPKFFLFKKTSNNQTSCRQWYHPDGKGTCYIQNIPCTKPVSTMS